MEKRVKLLLLHLLHWRKGQCWVREPAQKEKPSIRVPPLREKTEDLFVAHAAHPKPRDTVYSRDPFTFLAPQRIKWFPVYSNGQLLYPQGRAALMVNMADVQTCFAEVACLFAGLSSSC